MNLIRLFPAAKEDVVLEYKDELKLPSDAEFLDIKSFENFVNTILNVYDSRLLLSVSSIEEANSQLVVRGSVRNHCEVVCLFAAYFESYEPSTGKLTLSFNLAVRGTAVVQTSIRDKTLYFENIVSNNTEKIGRWQ